MKEKNKKKEKNCESKYEKQCEKRDTIEKERRKCTESDRKRFDSRRKNSSRASNESCRKGKEKRYYSQQSIFPIPWNLNSFFTSIPDILDTNISKTTQRFYASCNKSEEELKQICEKRKQKCKTKKKEKKCVKGPAKCISRKKPIKKTCSQSLQKEKDKKLREPTNHEKYCANRKKAFKIGLLYVILLYYIFLYV
ncbi:transcription initiation factor TFIID subunit 3-like [Pogonomyrmex barbatus]|uniref:Transcription initiation factor TFIID subunit 3-like n=1 Tax=Pogonomyrmex barbatus TaxID=144034 RepID=A0A8N1SA13_9HYME|nr:transcription initiation factor TFIID subunit 3-like [Pogonomyrmex barbatus]